MNYRTGWKTIEEFGKAYREEFLPEERVLCYIHADAPILTGSGCGEPQYMVRRLLEYVRVKT